MKSLLQWTVIIPILAWLLFFSGLINDSSIFQIVASILLILSVMSAVHHSEIIAEKVGEPYGTIILAISITVIEVSIIISLMMTEGQAAASLARDTVYAATMLILNGIVGLCLLIGSVKHYEQEFSKPSVTIALVSLISIIVFTLVFPTFTESVAGSYYSNPQLIFASIACLVIYSCFLFAQTRKYRQYFLTIGKDENEEDVEPLPISNSIFFTSLLFLIVCLGIVVLLAKTLSPTIESIITSYNLPKTLVGIVIAAIILLPEGIAAINAARKNRLQTSLNLSLGSALASIGLTIPSVAIVCIVYDFKIILGLDIKSIILLGLSVFTVMLSLNSGKTNVVYGVVLLVNLFAFIFLMIYP
ncbi:ionic transporter y4hA [Pontibacter sp. BT310]|jgi:Ca2+:H+ antiporter|uniref:Ionic transporter y4hA n=1 Tax=Pontibacter populi TaxID=890055 RepID=A0ABS6XAP3_9BACT|nr:MULTISPECIES: ionic transporter y4hA [Pontibacter]MBJ6118176.1 ionic transporter y4hA [Pontibacter sp. BT310]MBR0570603.1 ionic transporter y4hA [Microvirga sp. STS03]MBW3365029.1 ionic transporter y4hA [Pontibacter populi]